jgi:matrixin
MNRTLLQTATVALLAVVSACDRQTPVAPTVGGTGPSLSNAAAPGTQDPLLAKVMEINAQLRARGARVAIDEISFFRIGGGRPNVRIHQQPFRWVPNDARRRADGDRITYLVRNSRGATASGLTAAQTGPALDAALATWDNAHALKKVTIIKRNETAVDPDIFDGFFGFGGTDNEATADPFQADIVEAGWLPRAYFEAVGGPGGGRGILAFTVTFIFTDDVTGVPTDINGDNYFDTALAEVYYNDTFGNPATDRVGNPWRINQALPAIDVQTVALHENGHALELGHFGPPPAAVMNPVYAGIRQAPLAPDLAGMHIVWSSWPNP